jgi:hypothetical protein
MTPSTYAGSRFNLLKMRSFFARAKQENRILLSADKRQIGLLQANLSVIEQPLRKDAVVVLEEARIRIRMLPIGEGD